MHIALAHQPGQVLCSAGVDNDRPWHDHDLTLLFPNVMHFPCDLVHQQFDPPFARYTCPHERELMFALCSSPHISGFGLANRADPSTARHDLVPYLQIAEQCATGGFFFFVDNDHAVHALILHPPPITAHPRFRWINSGGEKVLGRYSCLCDRLEFSVDLFARTNDCAQLNHLAHDLVQDFLRRSGNSDLGFGRALALFP